MEEVPKSPKDLLDDTSFKSIRKSSNFLSVFILLIFYTEMNLEGISILGTKIPNAVSHDEIMVVIWIAWAFIFWRYYQFLHTSAQSLVKNHMGEYFKEHFSYKILSRIPDKSESAMEFFPTEIEFWNMFKKRPTYFKNFRYKISNIGFALESEIMDNDEVRVVLTSASYESIGKEIFVKLKISKEGYETVKMAKFVSDYFVFPFKHPSIISLNLPVVLAVILWVWTASLWYNDRLYIIWLEWFV